jgi:MFS family permease
LPPEHVGGAVVAGLRYAAHSPAFKATLWRASGFFLFASAAMSLMPTVAQTQLNAEAGGYGLLMGAVGGGAVFGALVLPYLRGGIGPNGRVALGTTIAAAATLGLALADRLALGIASAALFGFGWISVVAALNTAAQFALPDWVRARGLAIFTSVFFGAVAIGGLGWGAVATHFGVDLALIAAGVLAVAVLPLAARARLAETPPDLTPSLHWPDPVVAAPVEGDRGPIMVTIAYRIDPPDLAAALTALSRLESVRRRNGATQWGILQDAADPSALIEYFIESSWAEHLRHHGRVSAADRLLQDAVLAFHRGPDAPVIRHLIAPAPGGAAPEPPNDRTLG